MRQGLLDIDVLAGRHRIGCDDRVRVVGRGHHHGVCRLEHFVEHLAVVVVLLGSRVALEHVVGIFPVDVAQADDVLAFEAAEHRRAAAADTDTQDVEFVALCPNFLPKTVPGTTAKPIAAAAPFFRNFLLDISLDMVS